MVTVDPRPAGPRVHETPSPAHKRVMNDHTILLTIRETAEHLRVSRATVERMLADGRLPKIKVGASTRIARSDVTAYVESCRAEVSA